MPVCSGKSFVASFRFPASGFRQWTRSPIDVKSTAASNRICWPEDTHRHGATADQYLLLWSVPFRAMDVAASLPYIRTMDRLLTNGYYIHESNRRSPAPNFHLLSWIFPSFFLSFGLVRISSSCFAVFNFLESPLTIRSKCSNWFNAFEFDTERGYTHDDFLTVDVDRCVPLLLSDWFWRDMAQIQRDLGPTTSLNQLIKLKQSS